MTRFVAFAFLSLISILQPELALGQAFSDLPRPEYYVGRNLLGAGRTAEAAEGFSSALGRARRVGEVRWVDSIPPLVMLGECYYQQGSLAAAMEQYDAALSLALANPAWINQFDAGVEQLPALDGYAKGISWFTPSFQSVSAAVPEAVQIEIDPTQAQVAPNGAVTAPITLVTRLDATEVVRCMGIALLRRWQILGPLANRSPLAQPLSRYFSSTPAQPTVWLQIAWRALRGIHGLSTNPADAVQTLRSSTLLGQQFDYFLTPLVLIALAETNVNEGDNLAAITQLQDASLIAAKFEQHLELSQALRLLASTGCASRRLALLPQIQLAADWAKNQSGISYLAAKIGAAELAVYAGNFTLCDRLLDQSSIPLRSRDILLPRDQAHLFFVRSLSAFGQSNQAAGLTNLDSALTLMRGNAQSGAVVESVFQTQMTLDLLAGGALTLADAETLLSELLSEPDATRWQKAPLKTLAAITTASLPAFERWLQMSERRGDQAESFLRFDRLQRQQLFEALPLGGRLLSLRNAVRTPIPQLPPQLRPIVEQTLNQTPALKNTIQRIQTLVSELQKAPVPINERAITADQKKVYEELQQLASTQENLLAFQCLLRKPFPRYLPTPADSDVIQQNLRDGDVLISFVSSAGNLLGYAITRDDIQHWSAPEPLAISKDLQSLLLEIGFAKPPANRLPSAVQMPNAPWHAAATDLANHLFSPEALQLVRNSQRVIVAPHRSLWYVPFELLPDSNLPNAAPWLQNRSVCYVPTIGSYLKAFSKFEAPQETVALMGGLFSRDREINQSAADSVLKGHPNSFAISLDQKIEVPSASWLKARVSQLLVASPKSPAKGWDTVALPLGRNERQNIGSWLQTPLAAPSTVILPGIQSTVGEKALGDGSDLFLPCCGLLYGGVRSAVISRWSVGGKSTARLLANLLAETQTQPTSDALRRACLANWADEFLISNEPALQPAGTDAEGICRGSHPLLWSGYMALGDTVKP